MNLILHATLVIAAATMGQDAQPINTMCPVMTDEEIDPEFTVAYEGRVVGLCCDRCLQRFKDNPERYLAALPMWNETTPNPAADAPAVPAEAVAKPQGVQPAADAGAADAPDSTPVDTTAAAPPEIKKVPLAGRLHPAFVHLPIAALPLALLAVVVWRITGREDFARADVLPLFAAALGALLANYTGNTAEEAMRFSAAQQETVERHETLAQIVMYLTLALCALRIWRWKALQGGALWAYAVGLLAVSGLVAGAGYLGGNLVFGPDHFSW